MNDKYITIIGIVLAIFAASLSITAMALILYDEPDKNKFLEQEISNIIVNNTIDEIPFTINLSGGMENGDYITINGTVPNPNSSITGIIFHNKNSLYVTVVQIFQLTSDYEGFYTYDARINDDYLWKKDGQYTISIQNGDKYKEIYFNRST